MLFIISLFAVFASNVPHAVEGNRTIPAQLRHISTPAHASKLLTAFGAPGLVRTGDLRFRKPLLYPAELRAPTT